MPIMGLNSRRGFAAANVAAYGIQLSLEPVGDYSANAMIEAFRRSMQTQLLDRRKWNMIVELNLAMVEYIENSHKTSRRHSLLARLNPSECEIFSTTSLKLT